MANKRVWIPYKLTSAGSTNSTLVKAGSTKLGFIHVINTVSAILYLKLYDKLTAPTIGTDVPVQTYAIPHTSTAGAGFVLRFGDGLRFQLGLGFGMTTAAADASTAAVSAGDLILNMGYYV